MKETQSPLLKNKHYDVLKWLSLIVLPAAGALYFGLSGIWGLPYGEQVVGSIVVIETFFGVLLGVSSRSYDPVADLPTDGFINVTQGEDTDLYSIDLDRHLDEIPDGARVSFKMVRAD